MENESKLKPKAKIKCEWFSVAFIIRKKKKMFKTRHEIRSALDLAGPSHTSSRSQISNKQVTFFKALLIVVLSLFEISLKL